MRKKWQGFFRKAYRAVKKLSEVLFSSRKVRRREIVDWMQEIVDGDAPYKYCRRSER